MTNNPENKPKEEREWWVAHGRLADADDLNRWIADPEAVETIIAEAEKRGEIKATEEMEKMEKLVKDIDKVCMSNKDEVHCTCWPYAKDRLQKLL